MNVSKSSIPNAVDAVKVYSYQRPHEIKAALDRSAPSGMIIGVHISQSNALLRNAFMAMCHDAYDASSSLCHGQNMTEPEAIERYQEMLENLHQPSSDSLLRIWFTVGIDVWEFFFCFYTDEEWNGEVKPRDKFTREDETHFLDSFEDVLMSFFGIDDPMEDDRELPLQE
jgi:hypothetical protein